MKFCFVILSLAFCFIANNCFAQSDTINQKDAAGLKQGYWIFYGKDQPEKGFCDSCKVEEGLYKDDRKNGQWTYYHRNGNPRLKGTFVNGRPTGPYEKYYENGVLMETGTFKQNAWFGDYFRYYESGCIQVEKFININGKDSLPIFYYYNNCDTSISVYGSIQFKREKSLTGGTVDSTFYEDRTYKSPDSGYPTGEVKKESPNPMPLPSETHYKKPINKNGNPLMDGEFKDGKLWNGKKYIYDADGILLKVEIWKNGAYHSDGQL